LNRAARWFAYVLCRLVPKRRTAVLNGRPDFCDDVLALERALSGTGLRRVVILTYAQASAGAGARARARYPGLAPTTSVVAKRSARGVFHVLTAKYVFFTHSFALHRFPESVVSVNVWHGMPVKRVGWMTELGWQLPLAKYSVATSPFWASVVQESLRPHSGTLVTGLPRNDRLLLGDRGVLRAVGDDPGRGTRMIAWLPTYREEGKGRDARTHSSHVLGLSAQALAQVDRLLGSHNAVLVVKRHPLAVQEETPELSHIRYITDEWLDERGLTLHELLGESCALVTDVSSAYVDYLILDRPIVHHFPDIEAYGQSRGFSLAPIADYLAGPVVADPAGLAEALSALLEGKDTHAEERRRVRALFHEHCDGSSATRLVRALGLDPGEPVP
jgi:CDP-glycerol glycerophosphotransferase